MNRLGRLSALGLFGIGLAYAVTVAVGMAITGLADPIPDPTLAVMEALTLASAPLLVIVMCAIHSSAPATHKAHSLIALSFMIMTAGLTSAVHFVGLTALRQTGTEGIAWPSALYAVELLAWDLLLGLSLLFAAPVFHGPGIHRTIRSGMIITGACCVSGTIGPVTGNMKFQFLAVLGYGVLMPVVWLFLAKYFQSIPGGAAPADLQQ